VEGVGWVKMGGMGSEVGEGGGAEAVSWGEVVVVCRSAVWGVWSGGDGGEMGGCEGT